MGIIKNTIRLSALGAAATTAWSHFMVDHDEPLHPPLPNARLEKVPTPAGNVATYRPAAGSPDTESPVLLIHSVNAAASSYEMRPLFVRWGGLRDVVAMDLPGFGLSDRDDRTYTPELMSAAVRAVLKRTGPAHIVALSLGSEFAARAAIERPDLVRTLTLISPTGLGEREAGPPAVLGNILRLPLVGQALYDVLVTRPSLRYFLNKTTRGDLDEGLVDYAYLTSHQPNARFGPAAFLGGALFTGNAAEHVYRPVEVPVLVTHDEDPYTDFKLLPDLMGDRTNWRAAHIPDTAGLPHFDKLDETVAAIEDFWDGPTAIAG